MSQLALLHSTVHDEDIAFEDNQDQKTKKEPSELQKMIALRFYKARKLSGFKTELEAIQKIGLKNPKVISQIENCHRRPTLDFVIRAANAYGVSTDFLLGLSEDDDRSSDIAARSAVMRQNEKMIGVFGRLLTKTTFDYAKAVGDYGFKQVVEKTETLCTQFLRFCELNPEFEDMRGGAPLQSTFSSLIPVIKKHKRKIEEREQLLELHNQQIEHTLQNLLFDKGNN